MPDAGSIAGNWIAPDACTPVLVGFSGGLDSSVLLHALAGDTAVRARGLRAVHVHHDLHPDADRWAVHCVAACDALGIACSVVRVTVSQQGSGPEAAARHARHAAFTAELGDGETLALAHHRDDQAETFLLRALRGSGPDGLAAMRPWRAFARGWLWRPLLRVPRHDLLLYAQRNRLQWIEDPSNGSDAFDRNFLRNRVLPLLSERWPHADAAFARAAGLQAEAAALLAELGDADLASLADDADRLPVDALRAFDPARAARILRQWTARHGLPPLPANGVEAILRELLGDAGDGEPVFAWSGAAVHRWRNALHAVAQTQVLPAAWCCGWDGAAPLALPDGSALELQCIEPQAADDDQAAAARRDACSPPWHVQARQGGERIVLPGRVHSHALKHVLQDRGVPPWERRRLPLLSASDGSLLAAGNVVVSDAFTDWLRQRGLRLHHARPRAAGSGIVQ